VTCSALFAYSLERKDDSCRQQPQGHKTRHVVLATWHIRQEKPDLACLIKAMVSAATFGLWEEVFDLRFQYRRKSPRCHRSRVSGCTMKRACCYDRTSLASRTGRMRSVLVNVGRFTCRLRTMSCWRRRAFSARSSDLLRPRSVRVESGKEVLSARGLICKQLLFQVTNHRGRCWAYQTLFTG
jgi:hypothetical protein